MHVHRPDVLCKSLAGRRRLRSLQRRLRLRGGHGPLPEPGPSGPEPLRPRQPPPAGALPRRRQGPRKRHGAAGAGRAVLRPPRPHPTGSAPLRAGHLRRGCVLSHGQAGLPHEPCSRHDRRSHRAGQRRAGAAQHGLRSGGAGPQRWRGAAALRGRRGRRHHPAGHPRHPEPLGAGPLHRPRPRQHRGHGPDGAGPQRHRRAGAVVAPRCLCGLPPHRPPDPHEAGRECPAVLGGPPRRQRHARRPARFPDRPAHLRLARLCGGGFPPLRPRLPRRQAPLCHRRLL